MVIFLCIPKKVCLWQFASLFLLNLQMFSLIIIEPPVGQSTRSSKVNVNVSVFTHAPLHVLRMSGKCESGGHSHMRPMCGDLAAVDSPDVLGGRILRGGGI